MQGPLWQTSFVVRVNLGHGLTHRERVILFNSARRCEVHKLLTGELHFDYDWLESEELRRPPA